MKQGDQKKSTSSMSKSHKSYRSKGSFANGQTIDYDKLNPDIQWMEPFNDDDFETKTVDFVGHQLTGDDMSTGSSISSVSSSEYSFGWEFFGEVPATSGGNGTEDEKSEEEAKKPPTREPMYTPVRYPVWGEIEWESPMELQRIPSLELYLPITPTERPANKTENVNSAQSPISTTPPLAPRKNSFVEKVTKKLRDVQLAEKQSSPSSHRENNAGWMQRTFRSDSLSTSADSKVGLNLDSSSQSVQSESSIKSAKTIKSGNKSPKISMGRFSQMHLCNSAASSLSRGSK